MNHFKLWRRLLVALLLGLAAPWLSAIQLVPMTSTALSSPVFVGNAGDGTRRLFIVEQGGIIKVLQPGATVPTIFLDIRTRLLAGGERGLLGLAFHPSTRATAASSFTTPARAMARW